MVYCLLWKCSDLKSSLSILLLSSGKPSYVVIVSSIHKKTSQMKTRSQVCSLPDFLRGPSGASLVYFRWLLLMTEEAWKGHRPPRLGPYSRDSLDLPILDTLLFSSYASSELPSQTTERPQRERNDCLLRSARSPSHLSHHSDKWWGTVLSLADGCPPTTMNPKLLIHHRGRETGSALRLDKEWKMLAWSTDILKVENDFPTWPIFQRVSHTNIFCFTAFAEEAKTIDWSMVDR